MRVRSFEEGTRSTASRPLPATKAIEIEVFFPLASVDPIRIADGR